MDDANIWEDMMKKSNAGFSLVELVVVVLIMAIIAVALIPSIMQWVENSRISVDFQNYDSLVEAINVAITDENALSETFDGNLIFVGKSGEAWKVVGNVGSDTELAATDWNDVSDRLNESLGSGWESKFKMKSNSVPTAGYQIRVEDGHVYRDVEPTHEDNGLFSSDEPDEA